MKARPKKALTVQIVVRVEPELANWLRAVSEEDGRTLAQTIRWYLWHAFNGTTP